MKDSKSKRMALEPKESRNEGPHNTVTCAKEREKRPRGNHDTVR